MTQHRRLVSYGCSFTAGDELLDHELDPRADKIKRKQGISHWQTLRRQLVAHDRDQHNLRQRQLAWPGHVARQLCLELDNRARGGHSLAHGVYAYERDRSQARILDTDLVIVGMTCPYRDIHMPDRSGPPQSWIIPDIDHWPNPQWHRPTVLDLHTDRRLYLRHTDHLLRLISFPNVYLVDIFGFDLDRFSDPVIHERLAEISRSGRLLPVANMASMIQGDREKHGGHHPRLVVHERFAGYVTAELGKLLDLPNKVK